MAAKWLRNMALWCAGLLIGVAAHAQTGGTMLFVTTQDDPLPPVGVPNGGGGAAAIANARAGFQAQASAHGLTFVERTNRLSDPATSLETDIADASVLVLVTVYGPAASARMAEVNAALTSRPDLMVLAFVDGCCSQDENITPFMGYVNSIKPWAGTVGVTYVDSSITAPLNTASLYQAPFAAAGLNSIVGGWYSRLSNVPSDYRLYNDPGLADTAYGLFVPRAASNGGSGACLFMISDATPFGNGTQPAQSNNIAAAFTTAAMDPNGACNLPAPGVVDLAVSLTGPASLTPGIPAAYTLTVANEGVVASTATTVTVALPPGVTVTGALPPGCTATGGGTGLTCNVAALTAANPTATPPVAGGTVSFPIQLVATTNSPGGNAQATVPNAAGEINTANNTTTLAITIAAAPAAVPALDSWALLALGGLLPLLAARRRRRQG